MMPFDSRSEMSDDALMVLFVNGDADPTSALAHRHTTRVLALAFRLLSDQLDRTPI